MSRTMFLTAIVYSCAAIGEAAAEVEPVSLDVAVRTGLVEVEVKGRGACTGDAVQVDVRRKVPREVRVVVEPGMVLRSPAGRVQSMVCQGVKYERVAQGYRRVDVMVLDNDQCRSFVVEAFCRDFQKPSPSAASDFEIAEADIPAARVIVHGKAAHVEVRLIQIAIWLQKGVSEEDLRGRFRATDSQLKTARILVQVATEAEHEAATASRTAESSVQVPVQHRLDELLKSRWEAGYVRGDTVEVTAESAPIRAGRRTVETATKGTTYQVMAVDRDRVRVEFALEEGGTLRRGWISQEHVQLAEGAPRGEGRPLLRRIGELVSEADLEVITVADRGW